ncbi:hypothetical protein MO973_29170 [Paenibacillus sp. TRM 82003]|uniref:hypothetical protein n=1 Tax=Kineococcus sp. TRM81007 TaxID=2925831 RepID=UPI001F5A4DC3|nr:hypothetical protein [Kineococcus sp. TRM81007]MCI2238895.1 hypothetical protein [Kineococcus sp. TRM81007]MCI3924301.1 hypothetical protein [Paenibacillus sp. TRM 82003]
MSSVLHPVGPERRSIYWRRRLLALVLLLLLVVAAVLGLRALLPEDASEQAVARLDPSGVSPTLGAVAPSPSASGEPSASPSASPSTTTPAEPEPCESGDLELALTSRATTYGPDAAPRFVLTVRNVSGTTCTAEIGSGLRTFTVRDASGAQVWSSADCQSTGSSQVYELDPEGTRSMSTTWSRQRSAPGCPADQPAAEAGAYTVEGTWGEVAAEPLPISLTG